MNKEDVLLIKDLASFENLVNQNKQFFDLNLMVMPGTLEDKHKDIDPVKGIRALRRQFNLIYLLTEGEHVGSRLSVVKTQRLSHRTREYGICISTH